MIPILVVASMLTMQPNLYAEKKCKDSRDLAIFTSPRVPHKNAPLRIFVVSETPIQSPQIVAQIVGGTPIQLTPTTYGGPPYGWVAEIAKPKPGRWRVGLVTQDKIHACQKTKVVSRRYRRWKMVPEEDPMWKARWRWERDTENLYSVWIEHLFDAPIDAEPTWSPLHQLIRNPSRNLLYNHLNMNEDHEDMLRLKPDCADLPYFLRAYFAWKLRLPFGARSCSRGSIKRAPRCGPVHTNLTPVTKDNELHSFRQFILKEVGYRVHSGSGRTLPKSENSDYYPVALTRRALRPGTVFNDPYGHVLVIQRWVPQTKSRPGILFAVDAQPDATIGRRRFWRGSFLFPEDGAVTGAGFKRFRPISQVREDTYVWRNSRVLRNSNYGDFSLDQWKHGKNAFYEQMDALINPTPLAPKVAMKALVDALTEQVRRRVVSVDTGEKWKKTNAGNIIPMPTGAEIFQTKGPWESYSTPSRDLRLLIAIQTVLDFPQRIKKYPERFERLSQTSLDAEVKAVEQSLLQETQSRRFEYTRSDGSRHVLTVADVINRRSALEMAYNPNDCPEKRWGAPPGSNEMATCVAKAPKEQTERMTSYRQWFKERRRPLK